MAFSIYNYLNNVYASKAGGGEIDLITKEYQIVGETLHGLVTPFPDITPNNKQFDSNIIYTILKEVCSIREKPITVEHILYFRNSFRESFIQDICEVLEKVESCTNKGDILPTAKREARDILQEYSLSSKLIHGLARIFQVGTQGILKEKEVENSLNRIFGNRDWRFALLTDPPSSRLTDKSKRESLEELSRFPRL